MDDLAVVLTIVTVGAVASIPGAVLGGPLFRQGYPPGAGGNRSWAPKTWPTATSITGLTFRGNRDF